MPPAHTKEGSKQTSKSTTRHDAVAAKPAEPGDGAGKVRVKVPAGTSQEEGGDLVSPPYDGDTVGLKLTVQKHRRESNGCRRGTAAVFVVLLAVIWGLWSEVDELRQHVSGKFEESFNLTQWQIDNGFILPRAFTGRQDARPGLELFQQGYRPKHPVLLVPGFVTSGLELWNGTACAEPYFRQRLWGSLNMAQWLLTDVDCWLEHLALDPDTGLDPPGIKLRAVTGLSGLDYFVQGYAVWARLIQALADLGYDSNNLVGETFDWRLSIPNVEKRDAYFTRLKARIELITEIAKEKAVVAAHSFGDNVFRNFLVWVGSHEPSWVEDHIAAYVNIAGPALGVPKSITALLSGETRDTADMPMPGAFAADKLISRGKRAALARTWGSLIGMLPMGGPSIWGNATWAPDDTPEMKTANVTFGPMITEVRVTDAAAEVADAQDTTLTDTVTSFLKSLKAKDEVKEIVQLHDVDETMTILMREAGPVFEKQVKEWGAVHAAPDSCNTGPKDARRYAFSPMLCPLPKAPKMQMFCLYGVGKPAERSYEYFNMTTKALEKVEEEETHVEAELDVHWKINTGTTEPDVDGGLVNGVRLSDGDGTVPLLSLGLLCAKHWRHARLNPSGFRVVTREFKHRPVVDLDNMGRGGPLSADHVDILSNIEVLADVLRIAAGAGHELDDQIVSNITEIAERVSLDAE